MMLSGRLKNISDSDESSTCNKLTESSSVIVRTCTDCSTTRTPLWRGGPAGPRSLCNACGIRHRKKSKRSQICMDERSKDKNKRKWNSKSGEKCVMRLLGVGVEMRRKLREEEEAAVLLMAMSYGYGSGSDLITFW